MEAHPLRTVAETATGLGTVSAHLWLPWLHDQASEFLFWGGVVLLASQLVGVGRRFLRWLVTP